VSSRLRQPKPRVITAMHPWPGGRNPAAARASTRPVTADVAPIHGGVIVSEAAGDEDLRGEDVGARTPASTNWTIECSKDWRGIDRQSAAGHQWSVAAAHFHQRDK
jgi:hypothetical protein